MNLKVKRLLFLLRKTNVSDDDTFQCLSNVIFGKTGVKLTILHHHPPKK